MINLQSDLQKKCPSPPVKTLCRCLYGAITDMFKFKLSNFLDVSGKRSWKKNRRKRSSSSPEELFVCSMLGILSIYLSYKPARNHRLLRVLPRVSTTCPENVARIRYKHCTVFVRKSMCIVQRRAWTWRDVDVRWACMHLIIIVSHGHTWLCFVWQHPVLKRPHFTSFFLYCQRLGNLRDTYDDY